VGGFALAEHGISMTHQQDIVPAGIAADCTGAGEKGIAKMLHRQRRRLDAVIGEEPGQEPADGVDTRLVVGSGVDVDQGGQQGHHAFLLR
jgi:hypothetical protein